MLFNRLYRNILQSIAHQMKSIPRFQMRFIKLRQNLFKIVIGIQNLFKI